MLGYGVSKAALNQLVRGAALEWAPRRVRMNVVAPGLTRTPRLLEVNGDAFWTAQSREIPLGRPAETGDVASAVLFFCSDLSAHVTATVLPVDGGCHVLNQSSYVPSLTGDNNPLQR
jgi:NAD(P)-dependent dehydrogenase (short-subunit alcohol dehydrogenase family)